MYSFSRTAFALAGVLWIMPVFGQTIFTAGTVNSADYSRAFAPGALISIFGTNLAAQPARRQRSLLPTSLGGTSVQLVSNGEQCPLFFISPGQINAQLPFDVPVGQVQLTVQTSAGVSNSDTITLSAQAPKVFTLDFSGAGDAVATTPDYYVLTAALPAKPADTITLWVNSMGATTGTPVAGQPAPGGAPGTQPLALVTTPVVTIDGLNAPVTFAGLTPTLSGLYQVNVQILLPSSQARVSIQISRSSNLHHRRASQFRFSRWVSTTRSSAASLSPARL